MSTIPRTKYAASFPTHISTGRTGVESNTIVPFSHSRAMVNDVSIAAMIMRITAINPGTMKFRETRSVLYQTRMRGSMGAWTTLPVRVISAPSRWFCA